MSLWTRAFLFPFSANQSLVLPSTRLHIHMGTYRLTFGLSPLIYWALDFLITQLLVFCFVFWLLLVKCFWSGNVLPALAPSQFEFDGSSLLSFPALPPLAHVLQILRVQELPPCFVSSCPSLEQNQQLAQLIMHAYANGRRTHIYTCLYPFPFRQPDVDRRTPNIPKLQNLVYMAIWRHLSCRFKTPQTPNPPARLWS